MSPRQRWWATYAFLVSFALTLSLSFALADGAPPGHYR